MQTNKSLTTLAAEAKEASKKLRLTTTEQRNRALLAIAEALEMSRGAIEAANSKDLERAELPEAMLDRLSLLGRLEGIIKDLRTVITLPDPLGELLEERVLPNGLKLQKIRVPIGVIGAIYESRPNVTIDIASLTLKTGNCVILRGGKETLYTNLKLMEAIWSALKSVGLPEACVQFVQTTDRSDLKEFVKLDKYIDMIIPRGGEGLHRFCREESTIPVITGGIGICHLFIDESAHLKKAIDVIINAKTQRPSVCNALDTLLVHSQIASTFLPLVAQALKDKGVTLRLDPKAWEILKVGQLASEKDWATEWLSLILGIKVVDTLDEAIEHIQTYSTNHSDGILTESSSNAKIFVTAIDSAAVYVNASTRFTDGAEFGLGAEVAVSTQKLHARGPMGLKELTTYKWILEGNYHIR